MSRAPIQPSPRFIEVNGVKYVYSNSPLVQSKYDAELYFLVEYKMIVYVNYSGISGGNPSIVPRGTVTPLTVRLPCVAKPHNQPKQPTAVTTVKLLHQCHQPLHQILLPQYLRRLKL